MRKIKKVKFSLDPIKFKHHDDVFKFRNSTQKRVQLLAEHIIGLYRDNGIIGDKDPELKWVQHQTEPQKSELHMKTLSGEWIKTLEYWYEMKVNTVSFFMKMEPI